MTRSPPPLIPPPAPLAGAPGSASPSSSSAARPSPPPTATAKRKLVVVICRGAMDGLSVVAAGRRSELRGPARRDRHPRLRPADGALKLDDTFGLHPPLPTVHALALKGEARIAPAIATPDRARSHFEAQDVLENGAAARLRRRTPAG